MGDAPLPSDAPPAADDSASPSADPVVASPLPDTPPLVEAPPPESLVPTQPDERLALIDVLRGLALFGILAANMRGFAGTAAAYFRVEMMWKTPLDRWVQTFIDAFVQGKFITIFAFLFGVGFSLQFTRAEHRHARFAFTYARRLLALILIGALHQLLFWWGDILVTYALGGFILLAFRKRKSKTILIWALAFMLGPILFTAGSIAYSRLRPDTPQKAAEKKAKTLEDRKKAEADTLKSIKLYQTGTYQAIFMERLADLKREATSQPAAIAYTFPIFLLGLWVWRRGILQDPAAHRALLKKGLIIGAVVGLPANLIIGWVTHLPSTLARTGPLEPWMVLGFFLVLFGRPALSMSYACGLTLLFLNPRWQTRLLPFGAIGRTALSNYLLQTIVCTTLFNGYGGGLFGKVDLAWLLLPTVVIYALQVPLSNWWLRHYRFGPAEWAWRTMTYGKAPVMKVTP